MTDNQADNLEQKNPAASADSGNPVTPAESAKPKKPCCRWLTHAYKSEVVRIFLTLAVMLLVSAVFTLGLQLYALGWPPKSNYVTTPSELDLEYEDITITTDDNDIKVSGWFIPAAKESNSVILALHGYGSNKSEILPRVAFLTNQYNLFLIDFRYFGNTTGNYTTLGIREMTEVRAAMGWLHDRGYSDIGLYGMSMGGGMALLTLSEFGDARCGVVESPYVNLRQVVRDTFENFGFLADYATDGAMIMAQLAGVDAHGDYISSHLSGLRKPVLVIRPMNDTVVGAEQVQELQQIIAGDANAEYWFLPNKGYGEIGDNFTSRLSLFYEGCLFGRRVSAVK